MGLIGMRVAQEATRKAIDSLSSGSYHYKRRDKKTRGFRAEVQKTMEQTQKAKEEGVIEKVKNNEELYGFFTELSLLMQASDETDVDKLKEDLKSITEKLLENGIKVEVDDNSGEITFNGEHYTRLELSAIDLYDKICEWDKKNKDIDKKIEAKKKKIEYMKAKNRKNSKIETLEKELRSLYKKKEYRKELSHKDYELSKFGPYEHRYMRLYIDTVRKIDYMLYMKSNPNTLKKDEEKRYDFDYLIAVGIGKGNIKKENISKYVRMLKSPSVPKDYDFVRDIQGEKAVLYFCREVFPEITKPNEKKIEKEILKRGR